MVNYIWPNEPFTILNCLNGLNDQIKFGNYSLYVVKFIWPFEPFMNYSLYVVNFIWPNEPNEPFKPFTILNYLNGSNCQINFRNFSLYGVKLIWPFEPFRNYSLCNF